jgi:hypothetical protein
MSETQKMAPILVADVVGDSRLAGADKDRTVRPQPTAHESTARLKSYVRALPFRIAGTIPARLEEKCSGKALSDRE